MPTSSSLLNEAKLSGQRRLKLHFDCKLPTELYTSDTICADGTQAKLPVRVVLLDENKNIVEEGSLPSLKIGIFVVHGDFKAEESEDWTEEELKTSIVFQREGKGPLLVGTCVITMENGVGSFDEMRFTDNSSWVRSKKFRLGAKIAEGVSLPGVVEIRPAVSGAFRVKDQHGKNYEKRPVLSLGDELWRLEKIGKNGIYHKRLEAEGIITVGDFLQKYYMDPSSLRKMLGVKHKAWETIVQHATSCSLSHCAFEDQSKLVQTNVPAGWPSAEISPCIVPSPNPQGPVVPAYQGESVDSMPIDVLLDFPSDSQTPVLDPCGVHHQTEEPTAQAFATEDMLSWPDFNVTENYAFDELFSNYEAGLLMASTSVISNTGIISSNLDGERSKRFYNVCRAVGLRVAVIVAIRSNKTRMVAAKA